MHCLETIIALNRPKVPVINPDYGFFVVDTEGNCIVAGNEYKEDAIDVMDERNDDSMGANPYRVYTSMYLVRQGMNPYDHQNWGR